VQIARGGDGQIPSIGSLPGRRAGFRMLAGHSLNGTPHHPAAVDFQSRSRFSSLRSSNRSSLGLVDLLDQGTQKRRFVASRRTSAIDPEQHTGVQPPCAISSFCECPAGVDGVGLGDATSRRAHRACCVVPSVRRSTVCMQSHSGLFAHKDVVLRDLTMAHGTASLQKLKLTARYQYSRRSRRLPLGLVDNPELPALPTWMRLTWSFLVLSTSRLCWLLARVH